MSTWRTAAGQFRDVLKRVTGQVNAEIRTQTSWVRRAFAEDRDALIRALCFCSENVARVLLAATHEVRAGARDAFRGLRWGGAARGVVSVVGAILALPCRGVILVAVTYDVVTNLARTERVQ